MTRVRVKRFPDQQDCILVLLVLAVSFFLLRANGWEGKRNAVVAPIGSSAAMDGLWRDAVRPLKNEDMRPTADPDILWDEPRQQTVFPKPKSPPPPPAAATPEAPAPQPYFPKPREVRRVFEKPKLEPSRISFAERDSKVRSSAFLKTPEDEKKRPGLR